MRQREAFVAAILGSTESGKSTYVKQTLARRIPPRLLVWDHKHEYRPGGDGCDHLGKLLPRIRSIERLGELAAALEAAGPRGKFAIAFCPSGIPEVRVDQFNAICAMALLAGDLLLVVEELKFVTRPTFAPPWWAELTGTGRDQGVRVIATSQRPAAIDKDFLGNCTLIHTGRLSFSDDVDVVAKNMRLDKAGKAELAGLLSWEWLQRDMKTQELRRGRVSK